MKFTDKQVNKIVKRLLNNAKGRAKDPQKTRGNSEFSLTEDWLYEQLKKQNNRCPYTGVEFDWSLGKSWHGRAGAPKRASINRLNPMQGYTPENCEVVSNWYNSQLGPYTHKETRKLALGLAWFHIKKMIGVAK